VFGTPGQNARVTFNGAAGQRISIQLSGVSLSLAFVSILKPDASRRRRSAPRTAPR
jgi:hypothetical protein